MPLTIWTIGHSTRPIESFLEMLQSAGVERLADVRTVPRSRHNPQYEQHALAGALEQRGQRYIHMPGLGGLRRPLAQSINSGWRNTSFRGYADYMQTPAFTQSLEALMQQATAERTAIMCAEAVPWRCHRSLIADALLVRGVDVQEIVSSTRTTEMTLHPWAHVEGIVVTYPPSGEADAQGRLDL